MAHSYMVSVTNCMLEEDAEECCKLLQQNKISAKKSPKDPETGTIKVLVPLVNHDRALALVMQFEEEALGGPFEQDWEDGSSTRESFVLSQLGIPD